MFVFLAYWIAFGPHGPRAKPEPGLGMKVFRGVVFYIALSGALFAVIRSFGKSTPRTMNKEWQEASNEYLKEQKVEPITGFSAEGELPNVPN